MVLVDTSVLITYLRGEENAAMRRMQRVLDAGVAFGFSPPTCLEVLQGTRTDKDFQEVRDYLETHRFYSLKDGRQSYVAVARICFDCRRKKITINSTVDCLIAQTAIEHDLSLLHNDADFDRLRKVAPLKVYV